MQHILEMIVIFLTLEACVFTVWSGRGGLGSGVMKYHKPVLAVWKR